MVASKKLLHFVSLHFLACKSRILIAMTSHGSKDLKSLAHSRDLINRNHYEKGLRLNLPFLIVVLPIPPMLLKVYEHLHTRGQQTWPTGHYCAWPLADGAAFIKEL